MGSLKTTLWFFSILLSLLSISESAFVTSRFTSKSGCQQQMLHDFETYLVLKTTSRLRCAILCSRDTNCSSYKYLYDSRECTLNKGITSADCSNAVPITPRTVYMETLQNKCLHDGVYNTTLGRCSCQGGYIGNICQTLMKDCGEGALEPYYDTLIGFYYIFPPNAPEPFKMYCQMRWGGRNIIMQHWDPNFKFDRSYEDYQKGFIDIRQENFWIGLDILYYMTEFKNYNIHIELKDHHNGTHYVNKYSNIKIANASDSYRLLQLGTPTLNMRKCFERSVGSQFTTFDNDNDKTPFINCADNFKSGWWFHIGNCAECNPLGTIGLTDSLWDLDYTKLFWVDQLWTGVAIKIWLSSI